MAATRGRRVALWAGGIGVVVLVAAGFALKDRIAEEYWLWRLEKCPDEEAGVFAARLASIGSTRAVPVILARLIGHNIDPLYDALVTMGPAVVPALVDAARSPDERLRSVARDVLDHHLADDPELASSATAALKRISAEGPERYEYSVVHSGDADMLIVVQVTIPTNWMIGQGSYTIPLRRRVPSGMKYLGRGKHEGPWRWGTPTMSAHGEGGWSQDCVRLVGTRTSWQGADVSLYFRWNLDGKTGRIEQVIHVPWDRETTVALSHDSTATAFFRDPATGERPVLAEEVRQYADPSR